MAGGMNVDVAGFEASIAPAMTEVRHEAFDIGEKVADRWVELTQMLAPVLKELDPRWIPGALRLSARREPLVERPGGASIEVVYGGDLPTLRGAPRPYAQWVEFGTVHMAPRPAFRPAAALAEAEL